MFCSALVLSLNTMFEVEHKRIAVQPFKASYTADWKQLPMSGSAERSLTKSDKYLNFKASVGWSESTLNKGVLPTRGTSQSLVLETTIPGSDLQFYKLDYRAQLFQPLTDTYTMRLHTELGYGDGYGSTEGLPFYENY